MNQNARSNEATNARSNEATNARSNAGERKNPSTFKRKDEAIRNLKSYRSISNAELNLRDQITAMDRFVKGSASGAREYENEVEELRGKMQICYARRRSIERSLEALDREERTDLDGFFIHPAQTGSAEDLMELLGMEKTQVYRLRTRALRKFAENMFGGL